MTRKIMLLYNEWSFLPENIPAGWIITTDRQCFQRADVVVFRLPDLYRELEYEMEQSPGQLWVAWHLEPEKNYPWFRSPEIRETFDLWISYRQDADVVYPHYRYSYSEIFSQKVSAVRKQNKHRRSISGRINKNAGCMVYLKELMKHTVIDSHGRLYSTKQPAADYGLETRLDVYQDYKFIIAFEDAIETDYVTERFFEPLIAGSVPVYLGAPNIDDFAPGDNCFVDVRQFESPRSLAHFINACYEDEQLYSKFFEWKNWPLRQSFLRKMEIQKEHPLVRLCRKVDEMKLSQKSC